MQEHLLLAISPVDGRYASKVNPLRELTSEYGLIYYRVQVEVRWLEHLAQSGQIPECPPLSIKAGQFLNKLLEKWSIQDALKVKDIERITNHDVKAVEYYLKERFKECPDLTPYSEWIHFACTSEDINNLAYALMIQAALARVVFVQLNQVINILRQIADQTQTLSMLARTHGQPATPTTLGKKLANMVHRLHKQFKGLMSIPCFGKMNGAVGNFNAHMVAYPNINWPKLSSQFVEELGLNYNPMTTQIEPHDFIAEIMHALIRVNTILIDAS